ncbi:MAG: YIP1 family protein [Anaerolineae bacterium]|nr:YIP1 family protein [Anaerolineae bacterium]
MYDEQFSYTSQPPVVNTGPRPFSEIPPLWLKIFQMTENFFVQEAPRASGSNTLISILILTGVGTILATISTLLWGGIQSTLLSEYQEFGSMSLGQSVAATICGGLFGTIIGFYLGNGLTYLGARIFGGTGTYGTQAYLVSLFTVPIGIASSLLGFIPCIGALIAVGLSIYAIVLNVRAVMVTHNLTTGKATGAVLLPGIVVGALFACLTVFILILLGPAFGDVFEEIMYDLQY